MDRHGAVTSTPRRFDAPTLSGDDTLRVTARHDATSQRRRFDTGYHEGHAQGYASGAADVDAAISDHRRNAERLASLCRAFENAEAERRAGERDALAAMETAVLEMAMGIAETLIGREVADGALVAETVQRALQLDRPNGDIELRLHPADVGCATEAIQAGLIDAVGCELIADPSVEPGGCLVDAGAVRIDAQLGPALARVRSALGLL